MPAGECFCSQLPGGCRQGRLCPLRETEASCTAPLDPTADFPAPKGKKRMYRQSSSAVTGRAPRSMRDAFGCHINDPLHPMPDPRTKAVLDGFGDFANALGRLIARLFGR